MNAKVKFFPTWNLVLIASIMDLEKAASSLQCSGDSVEKHFVFITDEEAK